MHELEVTLERIAALLHTLAEMGMLVSPSKSKAILRCAGPGAEQLPTTIHAPNRHRQSSAHSKCPSVL